MKQYFKIRRTLIYFLLSDADEIKQQHEKLQ